MKIEGVCRITTGESKMTQLIQLPSALEDVPPEEHGRWCCARLEEGDILFFERTPFELPREEVQFLLGQKQSDAGYHKNIAYRPLSDRLTGYAQRRGPEKEKLHVIMRQYSQRVSEFTRQLLSPYAGWWAVDFASYRPQQEAGRQIRPRARNDLLHVDSFPTRPSNGNRILRVFSNINPSETRVWVTSETFENLVARFAGSGGMPLPRGMASGPKGVLNKLARAARLRSLARSPYDDWMLRFHHFLKASQEFQEMCSRTQWEFPPQSTWLVFTDMVSHAVLSGQFALEQTFIISKSALVLPEKAPVRVLERIAGCPLT
jgi:hypothetical protein